MKREVYKVLDLFAGIGGFSLGFKKFVNSNLHPFQVVAAVEIDRNAADTLIAALIREGYPEEQARRMVICDDITKEHTKNQIYEICSDVDVIIGGPPCQSFSMIGPRSGDKQLQERYSEDERDNLFEHYIEIVNHYQPKFFVFENVKGILSKADKAGNKYIDIIVDRFESIGYRLNFEGNPDKKYLVVNAADHGVPQKRERVIIIGNRLNINNSVPERTHCAPEECYELGLTPHVTVRDAIGDLPSVVPKITYTPKDRRDSRKKSIISESRKAEIDKKNATRDNGLDVATFHWKRFNNHFLEGGVARKKFMEFVKPTLLSSCLVGHVARGQQESDIELFEKMDEGMTAKELVASQKPEHQKLAKLIKYKMSSFGDKYKKMHWDQPVSTIVAHLQKDGNRYIHPDGLQGRTITVREAARLQSFPDDYEIKANGHVRYKYIGNAVPPLLSMAIAKSIYRSLSSHLVNKQEQH